MGKMVGGAAKDISQPEDKIRQGETRMIKGLALMELRCNKRRKNPSELLYMEQLWKGACHTHLRHK
jgi:hypothetical protein